MQSEDELIELIFACDGREKSNRVIRFMAYQNLIEKYMLFRDVPEEKWSSGQERVVELNLSRCRNSAVSQYTVDEIQEKIKGLRRQAAPIGNAGLIYSTSALEGYLSQQPYFWPGDVDSVIFDENNNVVAIIEFKKHTASSRIPFENQSLTNYLNKDILKYKSLALLRDKFNSELFVLYYPIPRNIDYIIVEKIVGTPESLNVSDKYELKLPNLKDNESLREFADTFITKILKR